MQMLCERVKCAYCFQCDRFQFEFFALNQQKSDFLFSRLPLTETRSHRAARLRHVEALLLVPLGIDAAVVLVTPDDEVKEVV